MALHTLMRALAPALLALVLAGASPASADPPPPPDAELGPVAIRLGLNAFAAGWAMDGLWAGLAPRYGAGSGYRAQQSWGDVYVRPGVTAESATPIGTLRGGLSASWGSTLGTDLYSYSDRSRAMLEDAWVGLETAPAGQGASRLELRGGRFSECFDGGFLLCQATVNGSERGLVMESPRSVWQLGALARAEASGFSVTAAYLEPQPLASFDTRDAFATVGLGYAAHGFDTGVGYIRALRSSYAYPGPGAPFVLIADGRDGLDTWLLRGAWRGQVAEGTEGWLRAIGAIQRQDRADLSAWGGYAEAGLALGALPLTPRVSLGHARFSGDNPATPKLERFDPLYYGGDGGLDGYFFGVIGPNLFLNTNLRIWRVNLDLILSPRDFLKVQALRFEADERNSPLQFGQGVRFDSAGGSTRFQRGVTSRPLGQEVLASYTRVLTANLALTATGSVFLPGSGLDELAGGASRTWYAAGLQLTYRR